MSFKPKIDSVWPASSPAAPYRLAIIGEYPSDSDAEAGVPFTGPIGEVLGSWMRMKEVDRSQCFLSHLFRSTVRKSSREFFVHKSDSRAQVDMPVCRGLYLNEELVPQLRHLRHELVNLKPRAVLAVGTLAMWGLTGNYKHIADESGKVYEGSFMGEGLKIVPVISPKWFLRTGSGRYTEKALFAMQRAKQQATT
jgi:DNA polymerase